MQLSEIKVGEEYVYLGQFVEVTEIECDIVHVRTRFHEYSTCSADELIPKPKLTTKA